MRRLYILAWCSALLAAAVLWKTRPQTTFKPREGLLLDRSWLVNQAPSLTPKEHCRGPDQTFLTYPEWFLVFGPAEYADYLQHRTSTGFPFLTHVFQTWESYRVVDDQTRGVFPPNAEYHTMIKVIATSSTVEFGMKGIYEAIVGRMTDVGDGKVATDEDRFNAAYAGDYVRFLDTAPWYEYDFIKQLRHLWGDCEILAAHPLRKGERRYLLTSDLAVKAIYGWLIKQATKSAYEAPLPVTAVVLDRPPMEPLPGGDEFKVLSTLPDGSTLATLPRYTPFTILAINLAKQGVKFVEIAGNRSAILITATGPSNWCPESPSFRLLFSQTVPSKPGQNRWALATPVASLNQTLGELSAGGMIVEHVFDY